MSRLLKHYRDEVKHKLLEKFGYKNPMLIPKLSKIVVNMGIAKVDDRNAIQEHVKELTMLSGQKPVFTKATKSISNFKLRKGQSVGLMVTLRGKRMYEFLDRFCNIVSPRIPDFHGFATKGDGRGNYSVGIKDQQIFPEINLDNVKRVQGMNVAFVTTAQTDDECQTLLEHLGFPFERKSERKK